MYTKTITALMLLVTVLVASAADKHLLNVSDNAHHHNAIDTLRFIVVGDTGTGGKGQQLVADAIYQVCQVQGCDFALALGDNVYRTGVTDLADEQFKSKFEQPYAKLNFPFYMVIGNHDDPDAGAVKAGTTDSGRYEVEYTYKSDKSSDKWRLPARYYRFDMPDKDHPIATFLSIDGASLAGRPEGQLVPSQLDYRDRQAQWLDREFNRSSAPWKIAFTHFPLYSNGQHGNAGDYGGHEGQGVIFRTLITQHVCGKADILFSGHDHDLQWLKPVAECGKTVQIVSGAGAKVRDLEDEDRNEALWQMGDTLGFFYIEVSDDSFKGTVYTVDQDDGEYRAAFNAELSKEQPAG
ncbi:MAG: acid phosphatase [Oceanospirillaceae bacterium]|nr:acid phosphatase [Oceanospirillaceae bacterium]MBT11019.1 acid phosphatase [Oceanospirillaceae bacterium]|tara:strand:- start:55718 stop:56770 length:1053 start_codon:yes stop_codon:yes gene_type:complete